MEPIHTNYIYLLHEREHIRLSENVYKVGMTRQCNLERFNNYPKGSILIYQARCNDCKFTESIILKVFTVTFHKAPLYGNEYFQGNVEDMIDIITIIRRFEKEIFEHKTESERYEYIQNLLQQYDKINKNNKNPNEMDEMDEMDECNTKLPQNDSSTCQTIITNTQKNIEYECDGDVHIHIEELNNPDIDKSKILSSTNEIVKNTIKPKRIKFKDFVNENCNDAINLSEFVNSIEITDNDIFYFKDNGIVQCLSHILISNMNKIRDIRRRPFHCCDEKRTIFYVKENDKWERATIHNMHLHKAVTSIKDKLLSYFFKIKNAYDIKINEV
jgi:hypothetical protein